MTEPSTPTTRRTSEEEDELQRSVKKFKDSNGARNFTQTRTLVSYRDMLLGDILGAYEQAFNFERNWDENLESDTDLELLIEGMVEVKLSKETFSRIRAPWSKALIVKVYGRTVGFNYLTFKINALWKPVAKLDCVNLGKDFFFIRFSNSDDYDKVLRGGPSFVGEHFLAIKQWEPYFKASEAKLSSIAMWVRLPELPSFMMLPCLERLGAPLDLFFVLIRIQHPNLEEAMPDYVCKWIWRNHSSPLFVWADWSRKSLME